MIETPCLLDTDTFSYIFKGREPVYTVSMHYLQQYEAFTISCMTLYESLRGHLANNATKRLDDFYSFLMFADIVYLDRPIIETAAEMYGGSKTTRRVTRRRGYFDRGNRIDTREDCGHQ